MKTATTVLLFILMLEHNVNAQAFLNGSFENTTAGVDQINLPNASFNPMMANTVAFGTYGDMDIVRTNTYCNFPQNGTWYVALTGAGTDAISMQLSSSVIAGNSYTISFYDEGCSPTYSIGAMPVQVGVSTVNTSFGTAVYTGPLPVSGVWQQRSFTFVAPVTALYITVQLSGGALQDWTQIDNFVITTATVLPVELLSFTAEASAQQVNLNWSTASEINNDYFMVERSADALMFAPIGKEFGAGNSSQVLSYSFVDENPLDGTSYYRLTQYDYDGTFFHSPVVAVNFQNGNSVLYSFNNPFGNEIAITGAKDEVEITLFDMTGKEILRSNISSEKTFLNTTGIATGFYLLKVGGKMFKVVKTE